MYWDVERKTVKCEWRSTIEAPRNETHFFIIKPTDALIFQTYFVKKLCMFRAVPLSIIRNFPLYIRHWYTSCRFDNRFQARLVVLVTVLHRNKFRCNKTNQMHQFHKFILSWNSTCFGQFLCPSSGVYLLYNSAMVYVIQLSSRTSWSCSKAVYKSVWHTIAECTMNKLLMTDRRTVRNM